MRDPGLPRGTAAVRDLIGVSGLDVEDCLQGTRLGADDIAPGSELRVSDEIRILANVLLGRPDYPDIGLDAGARCRAADFGMIGLLMRSCGSFSDALTNSIAFQDLCHPLPLSRQERVAGRVILTLDPAGLPERLRPLAIDQHLAAIDTIRSELTDGRRVRARSLELTGPPSAHAERYAEMFGVRPRFRASANRLVFDAAALDEPLTTSATEVVPQLQANCRALMRRRHARVGTTGRVLASLARPDGPVPSSSEVAAELGVSPRTLRRSLREEGQSFRALDAEVRLGRAALLLETTSDTLEAIGRELGYSRAAAFAYAFTRWSGTSPGAYRRAARSSARG